jgi:hypothetical protein
MRSTTRLFLLILGLLVALPALADGSKKQIYDRIIGDNEVVGGSVQPHSALADLGKRVALVIGNSSYEHVGHLPNATRDAADVAAALRSIGFSVQEFKNVSKNSFEEALSNFSNVADGADFAVIYYAGHGMEIDRQNYLIPIDAKLETDRRLRFEAIEMSDALVALDGVKGIRILLLDACRNNPFAETMTMTSPNRSLSRGLAKVEATGGGTVISFSAKEGTVALDGDGQNSPFAKALLDNITKPGLEIQFLFREVRDRVLAATDQAQEPYISVSLPRKEVYFVPPDTSSGSSNASVAAPPASNPVVSDFYLAKEVGTQEAWDAFLALHGNTPDNFYVRLAKEARQKIAVKPVVPAFQQEAPSVDSLSQDDAPLQFP